MSMKIRNTGKAGNNRELLNFFATSFDWTVVGTNVCAALGNLFKVLPKVNSLAKVPTANVEEWVEIIKVLLVVKKEADSFSWASLNNIDAPNSANGKKQLKRLMHAAIHLNLLSKELLRLVDGLNPETFEEIMGTMRRRQAVQLVLNHMYMQMEIVVLKWGSDCLQVNESVSGNLASFHGNVENCIADADGATFWKSRFKGRYLVPWVEFKSALQSQQSTELSEELADSVSSLLDPHGCGLISVQQFSKSLLGFGPFSRYLSSVQDVTSRPYFKGYHSLLDAARMLDAEAPGTFLVRLRECHPGQFAVAFVHPEAHAVVHVAVENGANGALMIRQGERTLTFSQLHEIVVSYAKFLKHPLEGNLASEPWFYGDATGREATEMLSGQTSASFLMRFSQGNPNCLATAYVANDGSVVHSLILKSKDGFQHGSDPAFSSLQELITAYQAVLSFPLVTSSTVIEDTEAEAKRRVRALMDGAAAAAAPRGNAPKAAAASPRSGSMSGTPDGAGGGGRGGGLHNNSNNSISNGNGNGNGNNNNSTTSMPHFEVPEQQLPVVAEQAILFLCDHKNAMTPEIFKKSKSAHKVTQLKRELEEGNEDVEISDFEPHVVAQLLRSFLREMSNPLVPEALFDAFLACRGGPDELRALVEQLPVANRLLMLYLLKMLSIVVEHKDVNKMDAHALAQVIGPNIMRRKDMSMEDTLKNASGVYLSTKLLIENASAVFGAQFDSLAVDGIPLDVGKLYLTPNRAAIKSGTVERLVDVLFTPLGKGGARVDAQMYSTTFRLTYQSFMTHMELVGMLREKYQNLESTFGAKAGSSEAEAEKVHKVGRAKIAAFISKWSQQYRGEVLRHKSLFDSLKALTEDARDPSLRKHFQTSMDKLTRESEAEMVFAERAPKAFKVKGKVGAAADVVPLELARQFTLLQSELYNRVQPHELLESRWTKGDEKTRRLQAGNVIEVIHQYNRMVMWVVTEILTSKKRDKAVSYMIQLAAEFQDLNNFNGLFAVCSGLENAAVARLDEVKNPRDKKEAQKLEEMKKILDGSGSYRFYRECLKQANPPVTPYLGVYLTDLLMIHDGNQLMLPGNLVNFRKCIHTGVVIQNVLSFQQSPYNLKRQENIQKYLFNLTVVSEDKAWEMSQKIQPSKN